jgi:hypothetical protein
MENSKYNVGKKYAEVTESVCFAYLYASIIPGGAVLIAAGICFFYWVDKRVLLRFSSINESVRASLSIRSMKLLDATLILRAIGEIIFDSQIRNGVSWQSYVCLGVGVLYCCLPMETLLAVFHGEKFRCDPRPYSEAKKEFIDLLLPQPAALPVQGGTHQLHARCSPYLQARVQLPKQEEALDPKAHPALNR